MNDEIKVERKHSTSLNQVECRVNELIALFPTRIRASQVSGLSRSQINRYLSSGATYSFEPLALMAIDRGVSLDWLATGDGSMMRSNNHRLSDDPGVYAVQARDNYLVALQMLEEVLQGANVDLTPSKKVQAVEIIAGMIERNESASIKSNIHQLIKLAS